MPLHATKEGHGPRLVLVHGFTQTGASWRTVAADLATDHEVVVVDAPGHGGSGAVRADLWGGAALLAGAGGPGTYVGYSMGGRLALHAALAHPTAVRRLVLLGATAGIDDEGGRAERRRADEERAAAIERDGVGAFLDGWLALPLFAGLSPDPADLAARRSNQPAGLASSLRLAGTGTQDPPLWDRLSEIGCPTLVLAGERDEKFRLLGERLAAGIGSNATFAVVADAGHAAHLERPAAFVAMLRSWSAAHPEAP